jgi:hypothetical protein
VDGRPVQGTHQNAVDELKHLAKVRVAGSNPVFRSNEGPGACLGRPGSADMPNMSFSRPSIGSRDSWIANVGEYP